MSPRRFWLIISSIVMVGIGLIITAIAELSPATPPSPTAAIQPLVFQQADAKAAPPADEDASTNKQHALPAEHQQVADQPTPVELPHQASTPPSYNTDASSSHSHSKSVYVKPYTRKDGTRVEGHYRAALTRRKK